MKAELHPNPVHCPWLIAATDSSRKDFRAAKGDFSEISVKSQFLEVSWDSLRIIHGSHFPNDRDLNLTRISQVLFYLLCKVPT